MQGGGYPSGPYGGGSYGRPHHHRHHHQGGHYGHQHQHHQQQQQPYGAGRGGGVYGNAYGSPAPAEYGGQYNHPPQHQQYPPHQHYHQHHQHQHQQHGYQQYPPRPHHYHHHHHQHLHHHQQHHQQQQAPAPVSPAVQPVAPPVPHKAPPRTLPPVTFVETQDDLFQACTALTKCRVVSMEPLMSKSSREISLLAIAPDDDSCIYVIDVPKIQRVYVYKYLHPVLSDQEITTLVYDIRRVGQPLLHGLGFTFARLVDLQSMALSVEWTLHGVNRLRNLDTQVENFLQMTAKPSNLQAVEKALSQTDVWDERPVTDVNRDYAAYSVVHHYHLYRSLRGKDKEAEATGMHVKDHRLSLPVIIPQPGPDGTTASAPAPDMTLSEDSLRELIGEPGVCSSCKRSGHRPADCTTSRAESSSSAPQGHNAPHHHHHQHRHQQQHQQQQSYGAYQPQQAPPGAGGYPSPMGAGGPRLQCENCGKVGHTVDNCFQLKPELAQQMTITCSHCGLAGHRESRCYDKYPHLRGNSLQCTHCGRLGHTVDRCHALHPEMRKRGPDGDNMLHGGAPNGDDHQAKRRFY
eukprot:PhM_4_TR4251/c0_g1_i1/m.75426